MIESVGPEKAGIPWSRCLAWGSIVLIFTAVLIDLGDFSFPKGFWIFAGLWWGVSLAAAVLISGRLKYVIGRLLEAVLVIWVVATLTFAMLRFLPGGPFDKERALDPRVKATIEAHYGLDRPVMVQYFRYLGGVVRGDFGESYKYIGRPVSSIIRETLPVSFQLGFYSILLAFLIGVPLGVIAASRHNSWKDNWLMILAISGVALPSFVVGPVLVMIFCFGQPFPFMQGWLPPALWESPIYFILPVFTLGIRPAAIIARMTRSSMLEVLGADFIRTGKAKGVSNTVLLYKHVLRNALLPVLTISGPLIAGILSGSFVVEVVFAIPGLGKHLVQSVTNRDYPLILGLTLVFSVMLVGANLVVDLLYSVVDPRIRLGKS